MREKKKVLFLANHFITLYNFRKELIEEIVNENEVVVSLPKSEENQFFVELGCKIVETNVNRKSKNPLEDFKLIINYLKIMKDEKPDVIFSYTIKPNIYGTIASNFMKIKHISNITGTGDTFLKNSITSEIVKLLYKISIKKSYKVFFQNSGDLNFFKSNKMIKENYKLIPGSGVNLQTYTRHKLLDDPTIRFIFIGRIMKVKGIEEYLGAAKKIKEKHGNKVEFLIAGFIEENNYKSVIENYHKEGIVNYLGFQKNIKDWIIKSHCTVLPSHGGEGVPNVLLESAAMGRPCIASNINGSNSVVEHEVNGFLFEAKSEKYLEKSFERFINMNVDEKTLMGEKGREKVENEFDRRIIINEYMSEL